MFQSKYVSEQPLVVEAVEYSKSHPDLPLAKVARQFGVKYTQLYRRTKGIPSKVGRAGANRLLNEEEERALCDIINRWDRWGLSASRGFIRSCANFILSAKNKDATVGRDWIKRFLKRHPEYVVEKKQTIAADRKQVSRDDIAGYFQRIQEVLTKYGIVVEDIWNADETGFRIGCGKAQKLVTRRRKNKGATNRFILDPDNREFITLVECISAGGIATDPTVVLKTSTISEADLQLPGSYRITSTETGYVNDEVAIDWLEDFDRQTAKSTVGVYRLLLLDGYGSHLTYEFARKCQDRDIILFLMPPHATHLLQPLDVTVFQPMKWHHSKEIDKAIRSGDSHFSRREFLNVLHNIRTATLKHTTIRNAWKDVGINPFNPSVVLSKIAPPADWESSSEDEWQDTLDVERTPTKRKAFLQYHDWIESFLKTGTEDEAELSKAWPIIEKYMKAAVINSHLVTSLEKELEKLLQATIDRNRRKNQTRKQVSKFGIITIAEGLRRARRRLSDEYLRYRKAPIAMQKKLKPVFATAAEQARQRLIDKYRREQDVGMAWQLYYVLPMP